MASRSRRTRVSLLSGAVALSLVAIVLVGSSSATATDPFAPQLVTIDTPTKADKALLQTLGLDLTEHAGHGFVEVVLHNQLDLDAVRNAGLDYDVRIADLNLREAENNRANDAYAAATVKSRLPSGRDTYRTVADYNNDMTALAKSRPTLAKRITLPLKTLDGNTVYGIEIGRNVTKAEDGRPVFLLMGLHHAREWPSGELAMEFAVDLVKRYGTRGNSRITDLLSRSRVIVVPVVNVDGFNQSRTDGDLVDLRAANEADPDGTVSVIGTPGNAYKRKNCRLIDGVDTPDGTCALAATSPGGYGVGVDLNRNYGGFWGGPGAADLFADPTYRGASAFSEPETQNIRALVSSRHVTTLISNHTFSNLVLRPNGVAPETIGHDGLPVGDAPDEAKMKKLGASMAASNGYQNIHGWQLYDTTGTTEDWSYNATGGFGYTFEIGPDEFHPPFEKVVDEYVGAGAYAGKGNRNSYLSALENTVNSANHSVITGKAPAGATLRLRKSFASPTWSSTFQDTLDTTMRVSSSGTYAWHINPSTRPVVQSKLIEITKDEPVRTQTYEGGATTVNSHVDHPFTIKETGIDLLDVSLDWPTPDDLDLEVYRKGADGKLTLVGSSGNAPAEKENAKVPAPARGDYVLRVINYSSVAPSYTLSATLFNSKVVSSTSVPGLIENWTLTCEVKGKVLQKKAVVINRGAKAKIDLTTCIKKAR